MLLNLSSACLYMFPLRRVFALAADHGYDGIELVMAPEVCLKGVAYVRALVREYGVPVLSVHQSMLPFCPLGAGPARMRDAVLAAQALECPVVVVHDPFTTSWESAAARRWMRELERCLDLVQDSVTQLSLENPGWYRQSDGNNVFAQPFALLSFARRYGLDVTYDTCHAGSAELGVAPVYDVLRERVSNVHLSDLKPGSPPLGLPLLRTLMIHHQMPGEGQLPLAPFVTQLAEDGYAGPVTLEISMTALQVWSRRSLGKRLAQAAAYVRSAALAASAA